MSKVRAAFFAASVFALATGSAASAQQIKHAWWETKGALGPTIQVAGDISTDTNGKSAPVFNAGSVVIGFEGVSQYDGAAFGRNFIPPDTMGAVGRTQYMATTNGAYAVFDKATGNRTLLSQDNAFWTSIGGQATGGDT